ncbi:MAG TPA: caspase family protein, partial [Thermoanaerobaculia bacterium]|nr:caspase family protein [Thermoanaerobaculia bacterium]
PRLDYGPYTALVIANSEYPAMDEVPGAVEEARRLATVMRGKYGFDTRLLENATRYQILSALNELREDLTEKHNLLIFYVGHSEVDADGQRSWWQPVDAQPDSRVNWISTRVLSDHLDLIPAKHVLVVADAGFSGVLTRSSIPKLPVGMSEAKRAELVRSMLGRRARLVLAAAPEAARGPRPSAFVDAFLSVLEGNQQVLEASGLYREICERLEGRTAIPEFAPIRWARSDGGSDFFFVPRPPRS